MDGISILEVVLNDSTSLCELEVKVNYIKINGMFTDCH